MRKILRTYFPVKRTFLFLIATLAITYFVISALLDHFKYIYFSHADMQNQSVVSLTANMVDERINAKLIQLQTLAYIPPSFRKNVPVREVLAEILRQIRPKTEKIGYHFIQITDTNGIPVSSNGHNITIEETEDFHKAIRGFSSISQIFSDDTGKGPLYGKEGTAIILSVPVFSGASVCGVLTAAVNPDKLLFLENIDIPYGSAALYLIDKNNMIIGQSGPIPKMHHCIYRSLNFFSLMSDTLESEELRHIRKDITKIIGNSIKHYKNNKNGQTISFASLPSSTGWKLVSLSSESSIRAQQGSLLYKIASMFLLITILIIIAAVYLYIVNWKYKRIRDLSRNTIDKTGFHFFKLSPSGEVKDYDEDFIIFLGISNKARTFRLSSVMDGDQNTFPIDNMNEDTSIKISVKNESGEKIYLLIQIIGRNEAGFYPAFAMDVTKDELMQEKIRDLAYIDAVTNISNKESFILKIEELNKKCLEKKFKSSILFININNSHKILEIFGHRLFQGMLRETAERLSDVAYAAGGSVYNLGGDDFVIVVDDHGEMNEVLAAAGEINKIIARPFMLGDASFEVTCRIGIVSCKDYTLHKPIAPSDLFRYGEITVRLAKTNSNIFVLDMDSYLSVINELDMEIDLISSIKNKELKLNYQPIYSSEHDRITALESLLRWESKKHGNVPPSVFIPMAEQCGFINQLGDFVIDSSFDFLTKLRVQHKNLAVNFNVSSIQFLQLHFAEKLIYKFKNRSLPKQSIGLEITESYFFKNMKDLKERLLLIKNAGINISVDDFGTGYSSLSYLKDLPVDYLKIDRSFIVGIEYSDTQKILFKGIIDIAKGLGMTVVAEGVETESQLNTALECGCSNIQGFFISRPMNEEDTLDFINSFKGLRK
ncbi:MAG: EAL domain-containing protein [Synergistaceae bacterium]|nr:EAL domain-containing protein [Synergistaceae bacterium]